MTLRKIERTRGAVRRDVRSTATSEVSFSVFSFKFRGLAKYLRFSRVCSLRAACKTTA